MVENTDKPDGLADALKYMETRVDEAVQIYELDQEKTNVIILFQKKRSYLLIKNRTHD